MNGQPTAAQKRFHQWVVSRGCAISGAPAELHHIAGARMKLKGVEGYAGEWFVIPLSTYWHRGGREAVHANRKVFADATDTTEREIWADIMVSYYMEHGSYPMSQSEYEIILQRG